MKPGGIVAEMTKAESDAQKIRQLEAALKQRTEELHEYIRAERILLAAGILEEGKLAQAHELARG